MQPTSPSHPSRAAKISGRILRPWCQLQPRPAAFSSWLTASPGVTFGPNLHSKPARNSLQLPAQPLIHSCHSSPWLQPSPREISQLQPRPSIPPAGLPRISTWFTSLGGGFVGRKILSSGYKMRVPQDSEGVVYLTNCWLSLEPKYSHFSIFFSSNFL